MQLGKGDAVRNRQHGDFHGGVFLAAVNCQGPEMWWRPGKNDQHQKQRVAVDFTGYSRPAQQGRGRAGKPADNNILRRGALQEHGIDERVAQQRCQGKPRGQRIDPDKQNRHAGTAEKGGEERSLPVAHAPASDGGTRHLQIDSLVYQMIHGGGSARAQGNTQIAKQQDFQRHHARDRHEHPYHRGEDHQEHNVGFCQLLVIPPRYRFSLLHLGHAPLAAGIFQQELQIADNILVGHFRIV